MIAHDIPSLPVFAMPQVAIIGAGQLARMLAQSAVELAVRVTVLANSSDEPAAQIVPITVYSTGDDLVDFRTVAQGSSVITFDHEGVDREVLTVLTAAGAVIHPRPQALLYAQDKLAMREKMQELGIVQPEFIRIASVADIEKFGDALGWNIVLKVATGGYDGRGVWISDGEQSKEQLCTVIEELLAAGKTVVAEEKVEFTRELAVQIARSPFGQIASWPVVQTRQDKGQCALAIAPAPELEEHSANSLVQQAIRIACDLDVTGVFTVELFEDIHGRVYVNELAMRPHNSGHWTMNGSLTSQFEQHLRAVLDYPLGDTSLLAPLTVMANVIGADKPITMTMDERVHHLGARMPDAKVHLYGKTEHPGRKIGHVNFVGRDNTQVDQLVEKAQVAAHWLAYGQWKDRWDPHGRN